MHKTGRSLYQKPARNRGPESGLNKLNSANNHLSLEVDPSSLKPYHDYSLGNTLITAACEDPWKPRLDS